MIWGEYQSELKRFVRSKVKDNDSSNDILQDVFIKLHSKIGTLKEEEKIRPWLYQISRNAITDYFRKKKFSVSSDSVDLPIENDSENNNTEFTGCVKPHINKLPEKYRLALTKVELENCSQLQLSKELNISYSALKSRVQRGRELLKKYFEACCDISTDKYGNVIASEKKHNCTLC